MTRANLNPKVTTVGTHGETPGARTPASDGRTVRRDTYASEGANPYRSLVSGNARAVSVAAPSDNSTPIGDMMGAIRNNERRSRMDPMQAFIRSLRMGDDGAGPAPSDFELPRVPDLQRDILSRNNAGIGLRPIVQRYCALERLIINLISNAQRAINAAGVSNMDPREIESLWDYKQQLRERLILCRNELAEARRAYNQERIDNPPESQLGDGERRPGFVYTGNNVIRTVGS